MIQFQYLKTDRKARILQNVPDMIAYIDYNL